MGGQRTRWLAVGVVAAVVVAGSPAAALPDAAPSPLLGTDAVGKTFPDLANARPVAHTFTVPDTPECKPLAKALSPLDQAAAIFGNEWDALDGSVTLSQDVWESFPPGVAEKLVHKARAKYFLECTRSTLDSGAGSPKVSEIPALEGPGHLLGDADVFFASGGVIQDIDGAAISLVTAWIKYDTFVTRLATQVPGKDFVETGRLTNASKAEFKTISSAATNILWQVTEGHASSGVENDALDALGVNANYTTEIEPTPPSADIAACKKLAKVERRKFPDQLTQFWRTEDGTFLEISRGFDSPKDATSYFDDLENADFVGCNRSLYSMSPGSGFSLKYREQTYEFPKAVLGTFKIKEPEYLAIGGTVMVTETASGRTQQNFAVAGALVQDSTVRLYFASSGVPASYADFVKLTATLAAADIAADSVG